MLILKKCKKFFRVVCLCITLILTGICFYKFIWNEDLAQIDFPEYHELPNSVYPTVTLCFTSPDVNIEERLKAIHHKFNSTSSSNFLSGNTLDDVMNWITAENISLNFRDYLEAIGISSSRNQTVYTHCSKNFQSILKGLLGYKCSEPINDAKALKPVFQNRQSKCFSIDIPFDKNNKVLDVRIFVKSSIFSDQQIKMKDMFAENFAIFIHYPKQLFWSPLRKFYHKVKNQTRLSTMNFKIKNMEVLRRRNKHVKPCNDEWNDDTKILETIAEKAGCTPPYWAVHKQKKKCTDPKQLKTFDLPLIYWIPRVPYLNFLNALSPPCQTILELNYDYSETSWKIEEFSGLDVELDFFEVNVGFPSPTYKEIIQVKAYDEESLLGYVGGYIGMFLGISLLQIPDIIKTTYKTGKKTKDQVRKLVDSNLGVGRLIVECRKEVKKTATANRATLATTKKSCEENDKQSLFNRISSLESKIDQLMKQQKQQQMQTNFESKERQSRNMSNEILF